MKSFARIAVVGLVVFSSGWSVRAQDAATSAPAATTQAVAKATPVDFRKLKELLPADLAGNKRNSAEGQKVSIGDFAITQATADYGDTEKENAPTIHVEIQDYGANPEMSQAMAAWQALEIDKESDTGYEKTTKVSGQPAYETFQNDGKRGEIQMHVAGRFHVNVTTTNLPGDQVKKIAEALPIAKLVELKDAK